MNTDTAGNEIKRLTICCAQQTTSGYCPIHSEVAAPAQPKTNDELYLRMQKEITASSENLDLATVNRIHDYWEFESETEADFDAFLHGHIVKGKRLASSPAPVLTPDAKIQSAIGCLTSGLQRLSAEDKDCWMRHAKNDLEGKARDEEIQQPSAPVLPVPPTIQRWSVGTLGEMESDIGPWVRFADVEKYLGRRASSPAVAPTNQDWALKAAEEIRDEFYMNHADQDKNDLDGRANFIKRLILRNFEQAAPAVAGRTQAISEEFIQQVALHFMTEPNEPMEDRLTILRRMARAALRESASEAPAQLASNNPPSCEKRLAFVLNQFCEQHQQIITLSAGPCVMCENEQLKEILANVP